MMILVVDGQGGGLGRLLVRELKGAFPQAEIAARRDEFHRRERHDEGRGGLRRHGRERRGRQLPPWPTSSSGAVGIVIADSMWGEITPRMAQAVGQSDARRVLIPINLCSNLVVGVSEMSMSKLVQAAVDTVRRLTEKK